LGKKKKKKNGISKKSASTKTASKKPPEKPIPRQKIGQRVDQQQVVGKNEARGKKREQVGAKGGRDLAEPGQVPVLAQGGGG